MGLGQNQYNGKWSRWIHKVSNNRWIVGEKRGEYWWTKNADLPPSQEELRGQNTLDLIAKGAKTYANPNSAIKALKRVYNPEDGQG